MVDSKKFNRDREVEYLIPSIRKMNFYDMKPYLTKEVIPQAIKSYAELCIQDKDGKDALVGSILYDICALAQRNIENGLSVLSESISEYQKKHGYSEYCEFIENTKRLWESSKLKLFDEAYFEEVIVDSIRNIEEGKADFKLTELPEKTGDKVKNIMEEMRFELNNTDFLPKTDPLGRLLPASKFLRRD